MKTNDIRTAFLRFFADHDHTVVPSASLIPGNDPTLLFTNAGMVQFKDIFLGLEQTDYCRATSAQRCVRAGGKHNDLENVGFTARHHTFFEMLGNFSFGDYFKLEAIQYAWKFLTEILQLPAEKLWVTVFNDDAEAADIWLQEMKVDPKRFSRCGEKDNFWSMGSTGPCGPCSEIFYDHGPDIPGGPPGSPDEDGDRYVEIWNLVFMQYNRDQTGKLTPLPKPSVDTGMGLERIAAVLQGVHNNFDIDLFQQLIQAIVELRGKPAANDAEICATRVIADHLRATGFLITDGVVPSNEGRGYVLRHIIRRAIRYGHQLGFSEPFFYQLLPSLVGEMGEAYPELKHAQKRVEKTILAEETQFASTLELGLKHLEDEMQRMRDKTLPGATVFQLYDTYGFPLDLTADIAKERGFTIDQQGFEACMQQQRQKSQAGSQFATTSNPQFALTLTGVTHFTGYDKLNDQGQVLALLHNNQEVHELSANTEGAVILDQTPFYGESGGQVGDTGRLEFAQGVFIVTNTQHLGKFIVHYGKVKQGTLKVNMRVNAIVNPERQAIKLNHSATHLLHAALRTILGDHVIQKGSLVEAERLRFDFAHFNPVTPVELNAIERLVNEKIRANLPVTTAIMTPSEAKAQGAMALFGEKYGDKVRVLTMGDFSVELCGGTHVNNTGQIGLLKITAETGIAAGIRRIEAVTGEQALIWIENLQQTQHDYAALLKTEPKQVGPKIQQLLNDNHALKQQLQQTHMQLAQQQSQDLTAHAHTLEGDIKLVATIVENVPAKQLRSLIDELKAQLPRAVIVLATEAENKIQLAVGVTSSLTDQFHAGKLCQALTKQLDGKGGGRADFAQGGGRGEREVLVQTLKDIEALLVVE